jgi:hypothetical protein
MTLTLNLPPDVEQKFLAEAQAQGVSPDEFFSDILLARLKEHPKQPIFRKRELGKKSLAQLFAESPLKGLDLDFSGSQDTGRPIDL